MAPQLPEARAVANRYLNAEKLERARNLAGARAGQFSGSGYENALRTEYRTLDRNAINTNGRGMGDPLLAAIENVARGTPASNAARWVGKLAPTNVVSGGGAAGLGYLVGGAPGAVIVPTIGMAGRRAATNMGIRNAEIAELTARNGGPLPTPSLIDPETERAVAAALAGQTMQYGNGGY
jgi:hypothetical protein